MEGKIGIAPHQTVGYVQEESTYSTSRKKKEDSVADSSDEEKDMNSEAYLQVNAWLNLTAVS